MSDPLAILHAMAPRVDVDTTLISRVRGHLVMTTVDPDAVPIEASATTTPARRYVLLVGAAVVLAAASWAVVLRDSTTTTGISCPENMIVNAVTGDPVADCAREWGLHNAVEAPAMRAYDNGLGGVTVLIAGEEAPTGFTPLTPGTYQDVALIELQASLADVGSGLEARCYAEADARLIAERELGRLGLAQWTVSSSSEADGQATCAYFSLEPGIQQVVLTATEAGQIDEDPYAVFAQALAVSLAVECVGLDDAIEITRSVGAAAAVVVNGVQYDVTEEAGVLVIATSLDESASCTRASVTVGGRVEVTLRGPAQ